VLVVMEDEPALEFVELNVLAVEFGGDVGFPVFGNLGELLRDVYLVHGVSSREDETCQLDFLRRAEVAKKGGA
jgi:hypothetical protein